jgi:ATP-dependent RNA helicase RhlE
LGNSGYRAASLQGNLSQNKRQSALDGFRAGSYQILVATDIAARGIDVSSISHVVNYDMPDTVDAYTHRIGRTGRAAKTGDAFTFMTREDGEMVRAIERVLGNRVERRTLEGFDYKKAMPGRDIEFARLPRKPQQRGEQKIAKPSGHQPVASASQKKYGGGREEKPKFRGGKARRPHSRTAHRRGAHSHSS